MTEVPQEIAERLAVRARLDSSRGNYEEAIRQQREAVRILERESASLPQDSQTLADERKEYAHRLSDYWGRLGGIYRKADMTEEAVEAYRHGMEIEKEYRLDDSYNRTNWIVLQVLDDPARLPDLRDEIEDAIALIQVQVEGPRRKQWWAWADLRSADCRSVLDVVSSVRARVAPSEPELAAEMAETIQALESAAGRTTG